MLPEDAVAGLAKTKPDTFDANRDADSEPSLAIWPPLTPVCL